MKKCPYKHCEWREQISSNMMFCPRGYCFKLDLAEDRIKKSFKNEGKNETEFILNNKSNIAVSLAKGICKYFKQEYKEPETQPPVFNGIYKVQLGAFRNKENAEKLAEELYQKGYEVFIVEE